MRHSEIDPRFKELAQELMRDTIVFMHHRSMRHMEEQSRGESAVLGFLTFHGDGVRAGALTEMFGFGSSRTAAILNSLEKKGFARRSPDPEDGRQVLVFVTDEGSSCARQRREETVARTAEFLAALGEDDARELTRIMGKAARLQEQTEGFPSYPDTKGPSPS